MSLIVENRFAQREDDLILLKHFCMNTNRRKWITESSLALVGLTVLPGKIFSSPFYSVGNTVSDSIIRLNSNENPYGPTPLALKAMNVAIMQSNRYPWETTAQLIDKIALKYQLNKENVLVGAGSSEILGLVAQYAAKRKGNLVAANPTFRIWMNAAANCGLEIITVSLTSDKKHDLSAMLGKINAETRLVYICNPNNPTGTVVPSSELKNFIEEASKKTLVLLDEAYTEYSDEPSQSAMVGNNKNLIIVKTFSKIYGLAGARIGYALAHPEIIKLLNGFQPWQNAGVGSVSLAGALASLDDNEFINSCKLKNRSAKEMVYNTFKQLNISHAPSHTNFLYYSVKDFKDDFLATLVKNNILAGRMVEEDGKWTRITIGTFEEMKTYTNILKQIWK
jgi:histidinol-phosphate aminotransferase